MIFTFPPDCWVSIGFSYEILLRPSLIYTPSLLYYIHIARSNP
jgi:hypothetical protein